MELTEERAYARLPQEIEDDDPFRIKAAQEFYLKSSETLRRLDAAVECGRRKTEEQVSKQSVEDVAQRISGRLHLAFTQFLSCESGSLMEIDNLGEFKAHAIDRFRGILHAAVKISLKTDSPIPQWAADRVREAWNIH